ncbi:hypothetical protein MBLNU457_7643t1 [Dothideomycetes sp. NU457]
MLDPFTALSVAAAVVQFVDYGTGLVEKAIEIHKSQTGTTEEITGLERMLTQFRDVTYRLELSITISPHDQTSPDEKATIALAKRCQDLAKRFLDFVQSLKIQGQASKFTSVKTAFKISHNKKEIMGYQREFDGLRKALNTQMMATLYNISQMDVHLTKKMDELRAQLEDTIRQNATTMYTQLPQTISSLVEESRKVSASHRILKSLQYDYMEARHNAISERAAQTFEWIFQHPQKLRETKGIHMEFSDWLSNRPGLFWISGKAGSGKSTLMKFLCHHDKTVDALKVWAGSCKLITANYFFWNAAKSAMQKSQKGLLRSLCYEVLRQCPNLIPTLCPQRWDPGLSLLRKQDWTLQELERLVIQLATSQLESLGQTLRFCFFIDGLDEYDGEHTHLIKILQQMTSTSNIKICASSRPWNVFQHAFGSHRNSMLILQELTRDDIATYVKHELEEDDRFVDMCLHDDSAQELVVEITDKANGVFLWVFLVVRQLRRSLENADSIDDLQRRLREFPPGLKKYFQHMFKTIDNFYRKQTAQIFRLCLDAVARVPLLGFAVLDSNDSLASQMLSQQSIDKQDCERMEDVLRLWINGRCRDLLEIVQPDDGERYVDFLHRTVKDFLNTKDMDSLLFQQAGTDFDSRRTLCIAYVFCTKRYDATGPKTFLRYAVQIIESLLKTMRKMEDMQGTTPYDIVAPVHAHLSALLLAVNPERYFRFAWFKLYIEREDHFTAQAVDYGVHRYVERSFIQPPQLNGEQPIETLLYIALSVYTKPDLGPYPDMVRMLIRRGASPDQKVSIVYEIDESIMRITSWEFFLHRLFISHRAMDGFPVERLTDLTLITEALIEAGAPLVREWMLDETEGIGEEAILKLFFGSSEGQRLFRLHESAQPSQQSHESAQASQQSGWWTRLWSK